MKNLMTMFGLENNDTVEQKETELVIYAKIGEPSRLVEANSQEEQVQLETEFKNGTRCRVRKVTKDGKDSFFFTFKVKEESGDSQIKTDREFTTEVDADFFKGFESLCTYRLVKTRYNFTSESVSLVIKTGTEDRTIVIPNVQYEVDVYKREDGTVIDWCKIDVEVDGIISYLELNHPEIKDIKLNIKISHLPFVPSSPIMGETDNDAERIQVDKLWEDFRQKI